MSLSPKGPLLAQISSFDRQLKAGGVRGVKMEENGKREYQGGDGGGRHVEMLSTQSPEAKVRDRAMQFYVVYSGINMVVINTVEEHGGSCPKIACTPFTHSHTAPARAIENGFPLQANRR